MIKYVAYIQESLALTRGTINVHSHISLFSPLRLSLLFGFSTFDKLALIFQSATSIWFLNISVLWPILDSITFFYSLSALHIPFPTKSQQSKGGRIRNGRKGHSLFNAAVSKLPLRVLDELSDQHQCPPTLNSVHACKFTYNRSSVNVIIPEPRKFA